MALGAGLQKQSRVVLWPDLFLQLLHVLVVCIILLHFEVHVFFNLFILLTQYTYKQKQKQTKTKQNKNKQPKSNNNNNNTRSNIQKTKQKQKHNDVLIVTKFFVN